MKLKDHEKIYFHKETVSYSLEKRRVDLITITDHSNKTDATEPFIKGLFPDVKNKKASARAHIY